MFHLPRSRLLYEDLGYTTGLGFCFLLLVTITSSLDYLHFSMTSQYFIFNLYNIINSGYPWVFETSTMKPLLATQFWPVRYLALEKNFRLNYLV